MASSLHIPSAPFDAIADRYDDIFTNSMIGSAQRSLVWTVLGRTFFPGQHILEIGSGTGVDACFLAERGISVTACDSSPRMVEIAAQRVHREMKQAFVLPRLLAAEHLEELKGEAEFDGAFSNFGVLNCVIDTQGLVRSLAALLRPGATALLCWMGPFCLGESISQLLMGNGGKAFRRFHRAGMMAKFEQGTDFHITYPTVRSLARVFAPHFHLKSIRGIGVWVPPTYCEPAVRRFPRLLRMAARLDAQIGNWPGLRMLADHILVSFERTLV